MTSRTRSRALRAFIPGILAVTLLTPLAAQPPRTPAAASVALVGALGSPEMIDFSGHQTFSARAMRKGLASAAEFLTAAHPAAPRATYFEMIRAAMERGYRHAGFPDAKAGVALDNKGTRVIVTIAEGPRVYCGEVVVHGAQEIPASDIVAALTSDQPENNADSLAAHVEKVLQFYRAPKEKKAAEEQLKKTTGLPVLDSIPAGTEPAVRSVMEANQAFLAQNLSEATTALWPLGKPTRTDAGLIEEVTAHVRGVLGRRNYPLAEVSASVEVDSAKARLIVRIKEGPRARIAAIEVKGNVRNSNEEIIQAVGLRVGAEASIVDLTAAKVALWNSARFYTFDVVARPRGAGSPDVDIVIEVSESDSRPLLREPLPRLESALVRFANWITTEGTRRELSVDLLWQAKSRISFALSPELGLGLDVATKDDTRLGVVFGRDGHQILVRHNDRNAARSFGQIPYTANASLWLITQHDANNAGRNKTIQMGASYKTRTSPDAPILGVSLIVSPAFACDELSKDVTPVFAAGVVTLTGPENGWKLSWREDTGELIDLSSAAGAGTEDATKFHVRTGTGDFARINAALKAIASALPAEAQSEPILPQLLAHPAIDTLLKRNSEEMRKFMPRVNAAARVAELAFVTPQIAGLFTDNNSDQDQTFTVPNIPSQSNNPGMIASLLGSFYYQLAVMLGPPDTWPARLGRELFYILTGNTSHTADVMEALLRDPRMGPIGNVVAARLTRAHNPALAWKFARRALDRGTAENFREDWRLLLDAASPAGEFAQNLVRIAGQLTADELTELVRGLPEKEIDLVRRAHATLRDNPSQPLETTLQPRLDEWWNTHMRPSLENRIGEMMAGDDTSDPVIEAFTVNGLPVSRKFLNLATRDPQWFAFLPAPSRTNTPTAAVRARDALLQLTLLDLELRNQGQAVFETAIAQRMKTAIREQHGNNVEKFVAALTKENLTDLDVREITRLRCIAEMTREQIGGKVTAPTSDEIARVLANPLPPVPELRHIRAIGFSQTLQAAAHAEKLREEVTREKNFDAAWTRYSKEAPAGARAFEFKAILAADMLPALGSAAFSLDPGAISSVIESGGWYYVLSVVAVNKRDSPEEMQARARDIALARKRDTAVLAHLARLRRTAIVRNLTNPGSSADNAALPKNGIRIELESVPVARTEKTKVISQSLERWGSGKRWSGGKQALCTSAAGGWVEWEISVPADGDYALDLFATRAVNFCKVQASIDGKDLGPAMEFFGPTVHPTGALRLGTQHLKAGAHTFRCTVVGKHPSSTSHQFGIDALDLRPTAETP